MRAASFACNDPFSGATLLETLCVLHGYSSGLQMCQVFSGALIYSHRKRGMRLFHARAQNFTKPGLRRSTHYADCSEQLREVNLAICD